VRDRVCSAALVRHSLNLSRALQQMHDAETRERLIANTYAAVNLEARFIQGMRVFFGHHGGALQAPLDDLDQAAHGGHKPAAYMLVMVLWRANSGAKGDLQAKQLLAEVADDDPALVIYSGPRLGFGSMRARLRDAVEVRVASQRPAAAPHAWASASRRRPPVRIPRGLVRRSRRPRCIVPLVLLLQRRMQDLEPVR